MISYCKYRDGTKKMHKIVSIRLCPQCHSQITITTQVARSDNLLKIYLCRDSHVGVVLWYVITTTLYMYFVDHAMPYILNMKNQFIILVCHNIVTHHSAYLAQG